MITKTARRLGLTLAATLTLALAPAAAAHALLGTGSITGHLTDGGNPVPNAQVSVNAAVWEEGSYSTYGWTTADGSFSFADVPAGDYKVSFYADGHPYQYAYQARYESDAAIIRVTADAATVVNESLLPTGVITGRFVDASGNGVQTRVSASAQNGGYGSADTGADGSYTFRVVPGDYTVSFDVGQARQFAYGTTDHAQAQVFSVVAGTTVTVNDTKLATGSIAGRFTDASGHGIAEVNVSASANNGYNQTVTDADGNYRIDDLLPDTYRVYFASGEKGIGQYAFGKVSQQDAARFAVTANSVTTVNDTRLGAGSLRISAKDAVTGAPVQQFWATIGSRDGSTENGVVVLENVPEGTYEVEVSAADGYLGSETPSRVTVVAGQQADVTVSLTPAAAITTTVTDAATGQPLAGVCVFTATPTWFRMPDGCGSVSDEAGKVTIGYLQAGKYNLFAFPESAPGYGAQWVGAEAGSGSQLLAKTIEVATGQTVEGPAVRLDKAGTITGKVTGANGESIQYGTVRIGNEHFNVGGSIGTAPIAADGTYSVNFLGPYRWPLLFTSQNFAAQWSGNVGNRHLAHTVKVTGGQSATYNITLKKGTKVVVSAATEYFVVAHNAVTGDEAGGCWSQSGTGCEMRVLGPQFVKFRVVGNDSWWYGGADFAHARPIWIPSSGTKSVTLTQ